ncbi:hypothetical protein [Enterovibrio norvegicus]|uniref:hypothetical protein n=1 Tax=Enterovibrio norvegicus TaxID=188144 RepID=UPI000C82170D|nr:hypothetical protein [Enterovibrio norvegicus]PML77549.1 hypothetical protein BCT69_18945 [Enterovibrio norvegicus]
MCMLCGNDVTQDDYDTLKKANFQLMNERDNEKHHAINLQGEIWGLHDKINEQQQQLDTLLECNKPKNSNTSISFKSITGGSLYSVLVNAIGCAHLCSETDKLESINDTFEDFAGKIKGGLNGRIQDARLKARDADTINGRNVQFAFKLRLSSLSLHELKTLKSISSGTFGSSSSESGGVYYSGEHIEADFIFDFDCGHSIDEIQSVVLDVYTTLKFDNQPASERPPLNESDRARFELEQRINPPKPQNLSFKKALREAERFYSKLDSDVFFDNWIESASMDK